jgi:hypothetical protein
MDTDVIIVHLNKFDQFMFNFQTIIKQYNKGDLSKSEFIEMNYHNIQALGIEPFKKIDNVKKGIFNYKYYNVLAKYYQKKAHDLPRAHPAREDYFTLSGSFYHKKDDVTFKLLNVIDYQGIEAYYVRVNSQNLKRKLIEIVIKEHEEMAFYGYDELILHTTDERILNALIRENVFSEQTRASLIDNYVNKKY